MPIPFTCPHCGRQTLVPEQYIGQSGPCAGCGKVIAITIVETGMPPHAEPAYQPIEENATIRMLIPIGRSGWAIAAGYAGLFAVLCFPAPIAIILGIIAIRDIKKHPKRHGMGRAIFGLVMGILFTILAILTMITPLGGRIMGIR
jgi:hypothetical protein